VDTPAELTVPPDPLAGFGSMGERREKRKRTGRGNGRDGHPCAKILATTMKAEKRRQICAYFCQR